MLSQTRFCSHLTAAHGTPIKQSCAVSVAMSAAVVRPCNAAISPEAEITAVPKQSRGTSSSNQCVDYLAAPERRKAPDLHAALYKASQVTNASGRAEGTNTAGYEEQHAVCTKHCTSKQQQVQQTQSGLEKPTTGASNGVAAFSRAHQQQQQQHTDTQIQQHQHSKRGRKSWTLYHDKLLRMLRQRPDLLPAGAKVLVAVSGGQDSMALMHLLSDLNSKKHWPLQLTVAHCDHRMRPDSADNAAFVQQKAEQLGLECHVRTAQQELRGEDAARKWRLSHLQDIAQQTGCSCYVLGHTATDRAETLLFNLIRGAGAAGLSSMGWEREVLPGLRQVRPLLWMDRADTAAFCDATCMQIWEDSTNNDHTFATRNLLRLAVFPHLLGINAKAVQHIASTSELLEAEDELLRSLGKQQLQLAEVKYTLQPGPQQQSHTAAVAAAAEPAAVAAQLVHAAAALKSRASTPHAGATVAAAHAAAASCSSLTQEAAFDAATVACMPDMFQPTVWHRSMPAVSQSIQGTMSEWQLRRQAAAGTLQAAGSAAGTALDIRALLRCPSALRSRVIWMWLQQQLTGVPTYLMVQEVLWLLLPRKGNGAKTGTLLDSCCVLRHKLPRSSKHLLVLVDVAAANQLHAGQLRLRVEPDLYSGLMGRRRAQTVQQQALQQLLLSLEPQPREYAEQHWSCQRDQHKVEVSGHGVSQVGPSRGGKHLKFRGAHFEQRLRTEVTIQDDDGDSVVVCHTAAVNGVPQVQQLQRRKQDRQQEKEQQQRKKQEQQLLQQRQGVDAGPRLCRSRRQLQRVRRQLQRVRLEQNFAHSTS